MTIKKITGNFILPISALLISGCGQDLPFDYQYLAANVVRIKYMDKVYKLDQFGPEANVPFECEFESDGDIDVTIAGKTYDVESPYDIDKPEKKKTTKIKKTPTRKTTKKKTSL